MFPFFSHKTFYSYSSLPKKIKNNNNKTKTAAEEEYFMDVLLAIMAQESITSSLECL